MPSGCLTGVALLNFASGLLESKDHSLAQQHIADCPLCADAVEGLRMWLNKKTPDSNSYTAENEIAVIDMAGKPDSTKSNTPKTTASSQNEFHSRTNEINLRIRQRLHTHAMVEASENKRLSYKPFVWLAAAASVILFVGSFYLIWIQNQFDAKKLAQQRANELSLFDIPVNADSLTIFSTSKKSVLSLMENKEKKARYTTPSVAIEIAADEDVFNQDNLSMVTPQADAIPENQLQEENIPVVSGVKNTSEAKKAAPASKAENSAVPKVSGSVRDAKAKEADANIEIVEVEESKPVFTIVEEMPYFPGGEAERLKFLTENIVYPQQAAENGIQGAVYVQFIIDSKGNINDAKVVRGIGSGCDEEALRVIKKMPRWKPGKQNGKQVRVLYNMPVFFKLQ